MSNDEHPEAEAEAPQGAPMGNGAGADDANDANDANDAGDAGDAPGAADDDDLLWRAAAVIRASRSLEAMVPLSVAEREQLVEAAMAQVEGAEAAATTEPVAAR